MMFDCSLKRTEDPYIVATAENGMNRVSGRWRLVVLRKLDQEIVYYYYLNSNGTVDPNRLFKSTTCDPQIYWMFINLYVGPEFQTVLIEEKDKRQKLYVHTVRDADTNKISAGVRYKYPATLNMYDRCLDAHLSPTSL